MNWRQLIIGIIIASAVFALIIGGFIAVVEYKPEMLGIKDPSDTTKVVEKIELPKPVPIRTVHIEPTVEISQAELLNFEWQVIRKDELYISIDSLKRIEKYLRDSIKANSQTIYRYKDSVKRANYNADKAMKLKQELSDSLAQISENLRKTKDKQSTAQKRIENYEQMLEAKIDTASKSNFITFAKMYDNTNPKEVAGILEQLDERDAAKILKLMNRKKAGKVLEAMKPENAAAVLLLGVGQ